MTRLDLATSAAQGALGLVLLAGPGYAQTSKGIYFNEVAKGGHFAAWERLELFATEIRAAFKSLR